MLTGRHVKKITELSKNTKKKSTHSTSEIYVEIYASLITIWGMYWYCGKSIIHYM